jgi:hypothetical protein
MTREKTTTDANCNRFIIIDLRTNYFHSTGYGSLTQSSNSKGLLTASLGIGRSWEESGEELGYISSLVGVLGKSTRHEE